MSSDEREDERAIVGENIERLRAALVEEGGPLGVVAQLNEGIFELSGLSPEAFATARVAAVAAMGAGPQSWRTLLELVEGLGLGPDEVLGTLVAVAPIIGTARFTAALDQIASL